MASLCEACGREEYMPFVCKMCGGRFCVEHRLPENHTCARLGEYKERARSEGRLYAPPPESVRPTVSAGARATSGFQRAFDRVDGKVTYILLGVMATTYVLILATQFLVDSSPRASDVVGAMFVLSAEGLILHPWTVVTSIFAHAGFNHLFGNALVLFFFGVALEGLIGSRRFLGLFMTAGVVGGLGEVFITSFVTGKGVEVVGASGAIMGVLGALTVLAPRLTVLVFFVIPAPLWLITALYALFDIAFLGAADHVAHLAHLAGLGVGLLYGKHLHDRGLRARIVRLRCGGKRVRR